MHDDEEISLGNQPLQPGKPGASGQGTPATPATPAAPEQPAPASMSRKTADVAQAVKACNDDELLDAILQMPREQLIPWEICRLPSLGLYYNWPSQAVEVRAMGTVAEKVLATQRLAQTGESIDYLFRECVRFPDPSFDPMDLLVGDKVFLLYYLRGITHDNLYEFALPCPECSQTGTHTYDLNDLAKTIKWANPSLGREPFKVVLPYLSECTKREVWVGVRFMRGRDTNTMLSMRKTKKRMFASNAIRAGQQQRQDPFTRREVVIDDTLSENLQMVITTFMGLEDRPRINQLVESRMHATDNAAIRDWLRENSPGIDPTITVRCQECGKESSVELPITESFFRPTQVGGK